MSNFLDLLILEEGLRNKPYHCTSGKLTIGIGRNLDDKGVSNAEAIFLCQNDIKDSHKAVRSMLPWTLNLDEVRRTVLQDMCINLGAQGLSQFVKTLARVERGDYLGASKEMLDSRWARQVGLRATRLAAMMRTGQWPPEIVR